MVTHTSITDFMSMEIRRFYRVYITICDVMEKRRQATT
jgi:hypothetical protein